MAWQDNVIKVFSHLVWHAWPNDIKDKIENKQCHLRDQCINCPFCYGYHKQRCSFNDFITCLAKYKKEEAKAGRLKKEKVPILEGRKLDL